jgi:hypothetical protein
MKFAPVTRYLRERLRRTSYEDIDEFRALLLLERLSCQPLRNWFEEAVYVGLRDRFPREAKLLAFQIEFGLITFDEAMLPALRRSCSVLLRLRKQRLNERSEHYRRERADWFAAGGLP